MTEIILFLLSLGSFLLGILIATEAKYVTHQALGYILYVIAAVFLSAGSIVNVLKGIREDFQKLYDHALLSKSKQPIAFEKAAPAIPTKPTASIPKLPVAKYYLKLGANVEGPLTLTDVRALAKSGAIAPEAMVRKDGEKDWQLLETLLEKTNN